jgi:2-isopropylmalate synthase
MAALRKMSTSKAFVQHVRRAGKVLISDTTLRDGEQMPGVNFPPEAKLAIAKALACAGVHSIDGGFAASSSDDFEGLRLLSTMPGDVVVMSLSRALRSDIDLANRALEGRAAHRRGVSIFLGTSRLHREQKLGKSEDEIIAMIEDSVSYAAGIFQIVGFAPEDASRTEPEFLCRCYRAAIESGATSVAFPDTIGILTPEAVREFVGLIRREVPGIEEALLAVHFHNDLGLAVANSLAAVAEGADVVQCAIGGLGERAGNAALEEVALALRLNRAQYGRDSKIDLTRMTELCRLVYDHASYTPAPTKPVCGANIFATEAGIHQDGMLKHPEMYLPYQPELVGYTAGVRLAIGKHSGRSALQYRLERLGLPLEGARVEVLLERIKRMPRPSDADNDQVLAAMARETVAAAGA